MTSSSTVETSVCRPETATSFRLGSAALALSCGLLLLLVLTPGESSAQTPFEFAVVRNLIQGDPFVSVVRIEVDYSEDGRRVLELSIRGGLTPSPTNHLLSFPAPRTGGLYWSGVTTYDLELPRTYITRVFDVLLDALAEFPATRIELFHLDILGIDELSWMSLRMPVSAIDSLLAGSLDESLFWLDRVEIGPVDVGTFDVPVVVGPVDVSSFVPDEEPEPVDTLPEPVERRGEAWKSLILPGWGQISEGRPAGWGSVLIEAAGIGLIVGEYYTEGGIVLGVNHVVSFLSML